MAKKTTAEILAEDYGNFSLLKDGRLFGLGEAAATPYVVQVSPDPNDANPLEVCVGDLFTVVVGLQRSDEYDAGFEPFRPLPTGVLDWVRDATNTTLVEELSHATLGGLDTDKVKFTFRALAKGTVSIQFAYNYVQKNPTTGELEVKQDTTTAITQVIKDATTSVAAGAVTPALISVHLDKKKYTQGEVINAEYFFNSTNIDVNKIVIQTTPGVSHTGTPTASGAIVTDTYVVGADTTVGTTQSINVYYDNGFAKVAKLVVYDPTYVAASPWGFGLDEVASPAVAAGGAAAGPAVAALDGGAAATPAAASLDDGAATPAAASEEPAASKSSKKSKAVAD